ncbi:Hypothetical protein PP7435_CHR4-0339 [Komagataella phaffii CBS 7435]|uniref:Uncharacterized protein n=2 Tax=Komagataella phaffii TaxID=460519 RepID=C4R8G5_KOMPG|nr:Hypothetical protein PAS_chr4_0630 [Komagataella phaffii GS115]AOA64844.1 GQ67_05005T0 [Komagataella phaffii]CAH2450709.1 Hypothetical protein BQ9382_C4-1770 [Komagataella phaffii CBS 7435]AOA70050.1 GQ68_04986T0 [Komagataella phaffii GS115]CAY71890.1 Hypothetical protein PAS_chr4_0630 [Komagataella phaffii GS115]CCA40509.1 Hypothetical protein PP7435_CHR4-0339 [Komagataella phaffii CBS 7435]
MSVRYPRVHIEYCAKCKWGLRANWYQQELFQTFGTEIGEVALSPSLDSGTFRVAVCLNDKDEGMIVWDRRKMDGFPDSKILKQLIRNIIAPLKELGHVDKSSKNDGKLIVDIGQKETDPDACIDCEKK